MRKQGDIAASIPNTPGPHSGQSPGGVLHRRERGLFFSLMWEHGGGTAPVEFLDDSGIAR
jgi:hypothetical protein